MDWSKAKTILIIALLFTNIFLLVTYGFNDDGRSDVPDEDTLLEVLEAHDIYLETSVPRTHGDMPVLSIAYADIDDEELELAISQADAVSAENATEATYKKAADRLIEKLGLASDAVSLESVEISGDTAVVSYGCAADEVSVDGCYMRCTFEKGKITDFEFSRIKPGSLSKSKLETVSAAVALMTFMNEKDDDEKVYIQDIEMVYWIDEESSPVQEAVTDVAFPFWKISYNDGKVKHIEAYEQ